MATSKEHLESLLSNKNIQAALHAIRKCEGTAAADGHTYLFGSTPSNARRFLDMSKHPNQKFPFQSKGKTEYSTAAGAYQILYATWLDLCHKYNFKDFTAHSQDLAALALFDGANCLKSVADGKMFNADVMDKLNNIWASLPGAGYSQPEKSIAAVKGWYGEAGGVIV